MMSVKGREDYHNPLSYFVGRIDSNHLKNYYIIYLFLHNLLIISIEGKLDFLLLEIEREHASFY